MRYLDGRIVALAITHEQLLVDQRTQDFLFLRAGEDGHRRAAADRAPSRVLGAFAGEIDEAEKNLTHDLLLRGCGFRVGAVAERGVDFIRALLQRAVYATELAVGPRIEMPIGEPVFARFLLPEQIERVLQQRQRPRLALHVFDNLLNEALLEHDAVSRCGLLDGEPQFVGMHVRDKIDILLDDLGELRERGKTIQKISPHRQSSLVELAVSCAVATNAAMKVLRSVGSETVKISSN